MKKILIPTDFSKRSYQTIDYITTLFNNEYCEFYILNTYKYETSGLNAIEMLHTDDDWFDRPKQESLKQLGKLITRYTLKTINPKHTFHAISESKSLEEGIRQNVDELGIDVVILTGNGLEALGITTKNILEKIRSCPILIVPPNATASSGITLTIASSFQEQINTNELERFIRALENTKTQIGVLVLKAQNTLSDKAADHLEQLLEYLKTRSRAPIGLEFLPTTLDLADYAQSHNDEIMCVVDKKPNLFRKIGVVRTKVISKLNKLGTNPVLTVHQ